MKVEIRNSELGYQRKRVIGSCAIAFFLIAAFPGRSLALEQWRCTTENFKGFDDRDLLFIKKNLLKQYLLTVTETEVLVKTISKEFKDVEERFAFVAKDILSRYAVAEIIVSYNLLAMPSNPAQRIASEGFFNATRSVTSDSFVNSWLLRCVE